MGGYYGVLHPAYGAFSDHSTQNALRTPDDDVFFQGTMEYNLLQLHPLDHLHGLGG
jgi:hypothetical protein